MSTFGSNFGAGFGIPDNHIADIIYDSKGDFSFLPATGFGDMYYGVYIDNVLSYSIYATEGLYTQARNIIGKEGSVITVLGLGQLDDNPNLNVVDVSTFYPSIKFAWTYDIIDPPSLSVFTDVEISGITPNMLKPSNENMDNRGELNFYAERVLDTVLVRISNIAGVEIATGQVSFVAEPSLELTLTESNSSGVSGTMTVENESFTATTVDLTVRYPKEMRVLRDASNPPTTVVASIQYNNDEYFTWSESEKLSVGDHYYSLQELSDTDDLGDASTPQLVTIVGAPEPVTNLQYVSGDYSNTVISFTPSDTVGATYNVYVMDANDTLLDTTIPYDTLIAGSEEVTLGTLPYAGTTKIIIRAVFGGIEEKNYNYLEIEYDSNGDIVVDRPNVPFIRTINVSSGNTINLTADYDDTGEVGVGKYIDVFTRLYDEAYDLTSATASGTISDNVASISFSMPNGTYYYRIRARTEEGGVSYLSNEVEKFASDENMTAPTDIVYYI